MNQNLRTIVHRWGWQAPRIPVQGATGRWRLLLEGPGPAWIAEERWRIIGSLEFSLHGPNLEVSGLQGSLCLHAEQEGYLRSFLKDRWESFLDLVTSLMAFPEFLQDLWWVEPGEAGHTWMIGLLRGSGSQWEGQLARVRSLESALEEKHVWTHLFADYLQYSRVGELASREKEAKQLYRLLSQDAEGLGLPADFPFLTSKDDRSGDGRLTVKVHPDCIWFLFFPLDFFTTSPHFPGLSGRGRPEWIVSGKSLWVHAAENMMLQQGLQEGTDQGTVIILNVYPHFFGEGRGTAAHDSRRQLLSEGFSVVEDMLACCTDSIRSSEGRHDDSSPQLFRWICNPSSQELEDILLDPRTQHIFADFHVPDTGKSVTWALPGGGNEETFDLGRFSPGALAHLRWMRIFHCHSLSSKNRPGPNLLRRATIVQRLLEAGVWKVEGSLFEENPLDYLAFLLHFLMDHLGARVSFICLQHLGADKCGVLFRRAESFLENVGQATP